MRITRRQLQRLISEAMPPGGVPDVVGAITGVPQGNIQNLIDEYKEWATEYMGTPSGANSTSVLATWIVMKELSDQHDIHEDMSAEFGFSHDDLMREIKRLQKEYDAGGTLTDEEIHQRGFKEVKISQIRQIIREELLKEYTPGYSVPEFENTESMMLFLDELEPDDTVETDVMDPETGEIWLQAGETPLEAGLVEVEPPEPEPEEEELDRYDWDAYEREMEQKARAQRELDDKMQEKIMDDAIESGKDWARDTLYQARENPDMWQKADMGNQYDSPEQYVLGFGQDAAGDVGQSLEYTLDSNEEHDWYRSLPEKEPSYYDRDAGRPTRGILKDIYADYFYDGVTKAVEEAKQEAA